ncbi:MAG: glycoside hydrolase family 88 protein [Opitutales bacterium]|jgi:rhamnogalacturonyl hydrolase YesR
MNCLLRYPALALTLATLAFFPARDCRADDSWGAWPAGDDPTSVGTKVVQNLLARSKLDLSRGLSYKETCSGYGAVRFALATNNQDLLYQVLKRYQSIITPAGAKLVPKPDHVDRSVFGILPLELYRVTNDQKYLTLGLSYADAQWAPPLNAANLSSETRYYIDDTYKISVMQIQAFHASANPVYATHAVQEFNAFIDQFQQPATGLFFHGPDAHVYWGRGNGWIASALAEVLLYLPADNPSRAKIMASYKSMMAGLLKVQADDGRWRQVLDDPKAWEENSCTGFFTFALGVGVNQGWLDAATYRPAVKKAWVALCGQLDDQANVKNVGVLTEHSNDEAYYLARPTATGDLHGQFGMLWAAWALLGKKS